MKLLDRPFRAAAISALLALFSGAAAQAQLDYSSSYTFATLAGPIPPNLTPIDGTGTAARFGVAGPVAVDADGNYLVLDGTTIRKVTPSGVVTTVVGSATEAANTDGTGLSARLGGPYDIAVAPGGTIYVTDATGPNAHNIRQITAGYSVTSLAVFGNPTTLALAPNGDFIVHSDSNNGVGGYSPHQTFILRITPGLVASDIIGVPAFVPTRGLAVDAAGYVYYTRGWSIQSTRPNYSAGDQFTAGWVDGPHGLARFQLPGKLALASDGTLAVADGTSIRLVSADGATVSTLAGTNVAGFQDGTGAAARFQTISGLAYDAAGNLIVCDNRTVRRVTPAGVVTTLAGAPEIPGAPSNVEIDGTGGEARFNGPNAAAIDPSGNLIVTDYDGATVRKVTPAGVVTTVAGTPYVGGWNDGAAATAKFWHPGGVAVDGLGNIYVADEGNEVVRKIASSGTVSTYAGTVGVSGWANGGLGVAKFAQPHGIAVDAFGNVYVSEWTNHDIRKILPDGTVTSFAGDPGTPGSNDGTGAGARFRNPAGLAIDASGNLYVADSGNATIRMITPAGVVTTIAGDAVGGASDGAAAGAKFNQPLGVAVDQMGNVYVADFYNALVRRVTPAGMVTTLGGALGVHASADGHGADAHFFQPEGIAVAGDGTLYVVDRAGRNIRQGWLLPPAAPAVTQQPLSRRAPLGAGVTFAATFSGSPAPTYQWYKDGVAITGATASSYHISHVASADFGSYVVRATNSQGSSWSEAVMLAQGAAIIDFNADGAPDILLENHSTGQRVLWLMGGTNNATVTQGVDLGYLDAAWHITGTADFNADGAPDVLLENTTTGQRVLWLMGGPNGAIVVQGVDLGYLDAAWHMVGTADFNADSAPDILLENTTTGQRVLWLMGGPNNAYVVQGLDLGYLDAAWHIAAAADFNADGSPDILLENTSSGQRVLWLMGGPDNAFVTQGLDLGVLDPAWRIVKTADFNGDSAPDILLENTGSGQRVLWLMGGPNNAYVTQGLDLGVLPAEWQISK